MSGDDPQPVVLASVPPATFDATVTYLADVLREWQLLLVDQALGRDADPTMVALADRLVPDLEALRALFRIATFTPEASGYRIEVQMRPADVAMMLRVQVRLVEVRALGRSGSLLVASDPEITQFYAWACDEVADQVYGRPARPYRRS